MTHLKISYNKFKDNNKKNKSKVDRNKQGVINNKKVIWKKI